MLLLKYIFSFYQLKLIDHFDNNIVRSLQYNDFIFSIFFSIFQFDNEATSIIQTFYLVS